MAIIELSTIHPDADEIKTQLQTDLSTKLQNGRPVWKDLLSSGTGETLIEHVAGIGAFGQYAVESALQENFRSTAKTDSSIRACVERQGIRLARKIPGHCTVTITRVSSAESYTIAAFSQFSGNGKLLFNRVAITFPIGTGSIASITLYEGTLVSHALRGNGSNYQLFLSPEFGFAVSDTDILVSTQTNELAVITDGLWNYSEEYKYVVEDRTDSRGRLILQFGNDIFGYLPLATDTIYITYATTNGANGNDSTASGKTFTLDTNVDFTATATTALSNGSDEVSPLVYKRTPSAYFGNSSGAVTPNQYRALPLQYPGVLDAIVKPQRELCPSDNRYMNLLHIALLTATQWTITDWDNFTTWYESKTLLSMRYVWVQPIAVVRNITMTVYISRLEDPVSIKSAVELAITNFFAIKFQTINTKYYLSDLFNAAYSVSQEVKFVEIGTPTDDMAVVVDSPVLTLTQISGGTIPLLSVCNYAVSAIIPGGETQAHFVNTLLTGSNGTVKLDWTAVGTATGYNIYGRTTLGMGLIATVGSGTLTYTDTGSATPTSIGPLVGSSAAYYNSLGTLGVTVLFTDRAF